ncbi:MAG: CoA transferase [Candidatus Binatus sp.]|uniref:CaiB/BaiF CoA transferase family protein n=1 Tax=Candidatus Binatus sp. TaxID=2811406 RepID=UPI0027167979|nr:CoA transferase [Candidatus Binatus sp.]MDO8432086.1 CoA transferase [Candidatus Binatus sp.]
MALNGQKHVLDGYKALDFTQFVAGPTVTKLMAEMGAEVIKVELAPDGDRSRSMPFIRNERSGYFVQQNRGKLSLCLDPRIEAGKTIIRELIAKVDVLVENFAPGVIRRMGFDYETVRGINPKIVMCSVSTFGQQGPLAHDPGYDFMGQAYAGVTSLSGEEGGPHFPPMLAIGDVSTGVHGLAAIACSLLHRERTGEGQYVDISLVDAYFHYHDIWVQSISASGGSAKPVRTGLHYSVLAPAGMFKAREGYIFVFAWLDHHWVKLCELMGRPELGRDPRFIDNTSRLKNRAEIIKVIESWLQSIPSDEVAVELLREARIPSAPVLTVEQAMKHPHLVERQTVQTVHDRILGELQIPGFPLRFSAFPDRLELEAPFLGEHNERILSSYLGYSPDSVARLEQEGVLRSLPR